MATHEAERAAGRLVADKDMRHQAAEVIDRHAGIPALKRLQDDANDHLSTLELKVVLLRRALRRAGVPLDARTRWAMAEYEDRSAKPQVGFGVAVPTALGLLARLWRWVKRLLGRESETAPMVVPATMRQGVYDMGDIPAVALLHDGKREKWVTLVLESWWPIQGALAWVPVYASAHLPMTCEGALGWAASITRGTAQDSSMYQAGPGAAGAVLPLTAGNPVVDSSPNGV